MKTWIFIFLGGGLGSITRFSINKYIASFSSQHFPVGTLSVNIIACFTLGVVIGIIDQQQSFSPAARIFWAVGFCGGFSTFSAFSHDIITLAQNQSAASTLLYIALSLILTVIATLAGLYLGVAL